MFGVELHESKIQDLTLGVPIIPVKLENPYKIPVKLEKSL